MAGTVTDLRASDYFSPQGRFQREQKDKSSSNHKRLVHHGRHRTGRGMVEKALDSRKGTPWRTQARYLFPTASALHLRYLGMPKSPPIPPATWENAGVFCPLAQARGSSSRTRTGTGWPFLGIISPRYAPSNTEDAGSTCIK